MINAALPLGYGLTRREISKEYSYFLQPFDYSVPPYDVPFSIFTDYPLPLSLAEVKKYLRIDPQNNLEDDLINFLIITVTKFAEGYTRRDFIVKKYLTYRDSFDFGFIANYPLTLRKSKFQSLVSFQYLVNNVFVNVPAVYYITDEYDYSRIYLINNQDWPTNVDTRQQAIQIIFMAGYGTTPDSVPIDLRLALMQHIAQLYENRGDCSSGDNSSSACDCAGNLPSSAKMIYNQYRIRNITTTPY